MKVNGLVDDILDELQEMCQVDWCDVKEYKYSF